MHIRFYLSVVGGLGGLRLGNGNVTLGFRLGDGGVLLDLTHVVLAQRVDEAVLVGNTLDVAGDDLDAQSIHVGLGLGLHLVTEFLSVVADLLQGNGANDLSHITLQGVHDSAVEVLFRHIQKVLHSQLDALRVGHDPNLGHGVHVHADKVLGGDVALGLDVDGDLTDDQLIHPLQKGDLNTGAADQHLGVLA